MATTAKNRREFREDKAHIGLRRGVWLVTNFDKEPRGSWSSAQLCARLNRRSTDLRAMVYGVASNVLKLSQTYCAAVRLGEMEPYLDEFDPVLARQYETERASREKEPAQFTMNGGVGKRPNSERPLEL